MFAVLIGYQYRSAAVVFENSAPASPDGLVDELRAQPGTRVPHVWVQRAGCPVSTLDLLGPGFTLFIGSSGADWAASAEAVSAKLSVPISVCSIGTESETRDSDGQWAQLTGVRPDDALLVRPDGFVAWRSDSLPRSPEDRLAEVLCQVLGRRQ